MELNLYQREALRTAGDMSQANEQEALLFTGVALAGEAGELCNLIKKIVWHGHPSDMNKIVDELGDVLWYVARCADLFDIPLEMLARQNLAKLRHRYPEGFSPEASIFREE